MLQALNSCIFRTFHNANSSFHALIMDGMMAQRKNGMTWTWTCHIRRINDTINAKNTQTTKMMNTYRAVQDLFEKWHDVCFPLFCNVQYMLLLLLSNSVYVMLQHCSVVITVLVIKHPYILTSVKCYMKASGVWSLRSLEKLLGSFIGDPTVLFKWTFY